MCDREQERAVNGLEFGALIVAFGLLLASLWVWP